MRLTVLIIISIMLLSCSEDSNNDIQESQKKDLEATISIIDSLNDRSSYYVRTFPDSGIEIGKKSLLLAERNDYTEGKAMALKLIGSNYWSKGYFDMGLEYFYKSLEYYEELNDIDGLSRVYNNIGLIYLTTKELNKSIEFLEKSIALSKKIDSKFMLGNSYYNLGLVYNSQMKYEKSIKQIALSLPYLFQSKNIYGYSQALSYQGDNFIKTEQYDKALEYLNKALESLDTTIDIRSKSIIMNHFSNYYLCTGDHKKALEYAFEAYHISLDLDLLYDQWKSTEYISRAYAEIGNFDSAYKYRSLYSDLIDSLRNEEEVKKKKEIEMEYNFSKKTRQMELEQHKKELEFQNQIYRGNLLLYFISAAFVLLLIVAFIIYRDYKQKSRMNDLLIEKNNLITNQKDELEHLNKELDESNSTKDKFFSIIAHDLRNPISALKQVTDMLALEFDTFEEDEKKELIGLLKKSSDSVSQLLDNLLTWSRSQRGIIEFEPEEFDLSELVKMIIDLQTNQAARKNIQLVNSMPDYLKINADKNMINTVIRNLISNAIKFTNNGGKVEINAQKLSDRIEIDVEDNGVGMDEDTTTKLFKIDKTFTTEGTNEEVGTGLGLILCKEFIDKHNGNISVESTPDKGSMFVISIPI